MLEDKIFTEFYGESLSNLEDGDKRFVPAGYYSFIIKDNTLTIVRAKKES